MKYLTKKTFVGAVFCFSLFSMFSASAAIIDFNAVSASWTGIVGGTDITGEGTNEIRWGTSAISTGERSGYRFDGAAPPSFSVQTGVEFTLGAFTHFNFPIIAGGAIESAQLNISVDLSLGGTNLSEGPFTFSFLHEETPNTEVDCCNDIVNFTNLLASDSFMIDGILYTLAITGFKVGDIITTSFSTIEGQTNTAELRAIFRTAAVPAPATVILFSFGLLLLSLVRRQAARSVNH